MRSLIVLLITALCVAAAAAIVVIVTGDLDETAGDVAGTAFFVPVYFATAFVQLPLLRRDRSIAVVGLLGVAISVAGFVTALHLIWSDAGETALRVWGSLLVASLAAASVAVLIRRHRALEPRLVTAVSYATLGATVALAGILIYAIATVEGDNALLARVSSVAGVLWALGIVLLPLLRATNKLPTGVDGSGERAATEGPGRG